MKDKILKKLNALEYLINSNGELFHDGINEELIEIINETDNLKENIKRLINHEENKLGSKKSA